MNPYIIYTNYNLERQVLVKRKRKQVRKKTQKIVRKTKRKIHSRHVKNELDKDVENKNNIYPKKRKCKKGGSGPD